MARGGGGTWTTHHPAGADGYGVGEVKSFFRKYRSAKNPAAENPRILNEVILIKSK
jgi:hypothetical protein